MKSTSTESFMPSEVTVSVAQRLLAMVCATPDGPAGRLIATLREKSDETSPGALLARFELDDPERALARGGADLASLKALKDRAKRLLRDASADSDEAAAVLAYFMAVAAAAVHHGQNLSSRPLDEVCPVLEQLGTALPSPYADLAHKAAIQIRQASNGS